MSETGPLIVCTRGSALALAQANMVLRYCRSAFPTRKFEMRIIKTTGDKLQTASLAAGDASLPKGLFTKELENALMAGEGDLAVHSLKDLPTELPEGLTLGAVLPRADVRDVIIYRSAEAVAAGRNPLAEWAPGQKEMFGFGPRLTFKDLPQGFVAATSSTRRAAQVRAIRPDAQIVAIRGNVGTRLRKLRDDASFDVTLLAAAGLVRLHLDIAPTGELRVDPRLAASVRGEVETPPPGIRASLIEPEEMIPAVGQGAVAIEVRTNDESTREICAALNHFNTFQAITAERSFLRAMGGGCQSPVAGYARVVGHRLHLMAATFEDGTPKKAEAALPVRDAEQLGRNVAEQLKRI
jgi:hydroxymethylbilane synthase